MNSDPAEEPTARGPDRRERASALPAEEERRRTPDRRSLGHLARSPLFSGLPFHFLEDLIERCPARELDAGEALLEPGHLNDRMFLVLAGRLLVRLGEEGSPDSIPIGPGGTLGELSIIDGKPVSAFVSASEASRVLAIPADVFWNTLSGSPRFARNLAGVLSARMRANNDRIIARIRDHFALEHLHKELHIARSIQAGMLPGRGRLFGSREDVDVYGLMDPAHDIGGDLYDSFFVGPDRLVAVIGDVSGKGIPAALFMARVIAQLRLVAISETSPAAVLSRLNGLLCEHNDAGMFVTLLILVLDVVDGTFVYSNAGHNPPVVMRQHETRFLPMPKGLVAGLVAGAPYRELQGRLAPGEGLLLYTDGVTEALDTVLSCYGDERLTGVLERLAGTCAESVVRAVSEDVRAFSQGTNQSDDITMLALRRPG